VFWDFDTCSVPACVKQVREPVVLSTAVNVPMFEFTSLLGAQSASPASQSLLELEGGIKILVDVGWDESFDPSLLEELEK
jgi:hypothetical protein